MQYRPLLSASVTAFAVMASVAMAADLPTRSAPTFAPVAGPSFTWTGFYVGANAGYGWTANNGFRVTGSEGFFFNQPGFPGFQHSDGNGFVGGGQVGYNYQVGSFVAGVEADLAYANLKATTRGSLASPFLPNPSMLGRTLTGSAPFVRVSVSRR